VDLWLARAFNTHDVEAAAAMYHPDASVVRLDQVHGTGAVARGTAGIREAMAGYIGLKPHMDVVVPHTTVSGDFALCRSQWRITGTDENGNPIEVHHHGMEVMRSAKRRVGVLHRPPLGSRPVVGSGPAATYGVMPEPFDVPCLVRILQERRTEQIVHTAATPTPNVVASLSHHLLQLKGSGPSAAAESRSAALVV
jgi:ketosteroid isomerase-like protein